MNNKKWGCIGVSYECAERIKRFCARTGLSQGQVVDLATSDVCHDGSMLGATARMMFKIARPEVRP